MDILMAEAIKIFAPAAITILTGLVSWGTFEITKFFKTKTKNEMVNDAVKHICHTTETVVGELSQTVVKELKKSSSTGKLTEVQGEEIKEMAYSKVREIVPVALQKTSELAVGSFNVFLKSKIQKAVFDQKPKEMRSI